jgi:hypothetical protein
MSSQNHIKEKGNKSNSTVLPLWETGSPSEAGVNGAVNRNTGSSVYKYKSKKNQSVC